MAGISISGLVSNSFDWQSVVNQLIDIEKRPIARLQTEQAENIDAIASLTGIKTGLTGLQSAVKALSADGLFNGRTASSSTAGSGWTMTAASGTTAGSYTIAVSQLATAARRMGASSISGNLNAAATDIGTNPDGVAGLTLATLPTASAITSGESFFTLNGQRVTINSTDSLQAVFDRISDVTGGEVTASYNAATDKIALSSSSEIVLGAANDTSNFLSVMRLANNGSGAISSSSALGSAALTLPLADSRLSGSFGSVDAEGNGAFEVNGVSIAYNVNTDSLSSVLSRITASSAGVNAVYDRVADRVMLTNKSTGDTGMSVNDTTGSLASALGLTSGFTTVRGLNAEFSVNGGDVQSSVTNTLDGSALGIEGLSVTVNSETSQTIEVSGNTAGMKAAIDKFISAFNDVQKYIDTETKITKSADGKVTAAVLAGNQEVDGWASRLRSLAFSQVSGLTGTITRLESLGIDFDSSSSTLKIKDSSKLDAALKEKAADVGAFFGTAQTGFSAVFGDYLDKTLNERSGALVTQVNSLNKQNTGIEEQIEALNRRIENQRLLLTDAFIAMQNAQSKANTQQDALDNMLKQMNRD